MHEVREGGREGGRTYLSDVLNRVVTATALIHQVRRDERDSGPGTPEAPDRHTDTHEGQEGREGGKEGGRKGGLTSVMC